MRYCQFNPDIVPLSQQTFVELLLNCKDFTKSDRLLGSSKGRGTTWFINTMEELGVNSVLRHYYRGGLFGKLVKDRYFFTTNQNTRAVQEFNLLEQLVQWELPVPRPIACQITRQFFCYQADILLEKIANTQDLSQYLQNNRLTPQQYQKIGGLIRQLHDHQVHHSDLNIHNILLDDQGKFWLIDFDKCKIQPGCRWKQQNLERLHRSFLKEKTRLGILFNEQDWQMLLEGYAK
ncbi:3-deoxy-D-manno-octulosonic acid kinase [Ursidibacter maritimus]|uniref:3-deoxy-D-manno-octulosonic acid kinase n=1 Tax=Ursidibacter maritimus TaxID=1331689 RepID=A0A949T0I4_9PAST|nr:3-deoxy-D-manno-octulosonic acid kinase [Ursidibacter maritimus]KAE9540256.1 3-deoxy-D-manno-octulosonic acid kinase [Ursidibacter maritimus]MBV6524808.1 3-deoxy-D-manno-octulosonic acid kinase [Ursidibacter maritimus]MBV6525637.1 3-deoxy-D-manno-octulosonic acid kinase [Ursidibacter maritimus]MBV6528126.1 3-deoxy-D-manno-octulosonic acid kinase [Ursidibacter maritimus]MBV6528946.1 3-deoxy-D-manno-octulosonic acid kinase [Ursidibacter maritimus]